MSDRPMTRAGSQPVFKEVYGKRSVSQVNRKAPAMKRFAVSDAIRRQGLRTYRRSR